MSIRLLHTKNLTFHIFKTEDFTKVPRYAILSHVWDSHDEAVSPGSFKAALQHGRTHRDRLGHGFQKIITFCRQAAADGLEYAWADTGCIDKENEVELSFAINSMFRWYQKSAVCYVYLADVPRNVNLADPNSAFVKSRWFTRGWTLQELIAPKSVVFFAADWHYLSTKAALKHIIADVTGVDLRVLETGDASTASVSTKLSWVKSRKTTLAEDRAYCLLGIFDIFMPLMYGEKEAAFRRMLDEIASRENDQTIFSWAGDGRPCGMIAPSPAHFVPSRDASTVIKTVRNPAFSITNRGVRITAPLIALPLRNMYAMVLNSLPAAGSPGSENYFLVHFIYRLYDDHNDYIRVHSDELAYFPAHLKQTQPSLLKNTEVFVDKPLRPGFAMNNTVTFCLKNYPSVSARPGPTVLGPPNMVGHFSAMQQRPGQPHIITMQLDDQMPSTVMLFKNDAGQQIAVCLTAWGDKIKVGLSADCANADLSQIADAFLFGKIPMTFKQPGNFATQATDRKSVV